MRTAPAIWPLLLLACNSPALTGGVADLAAGDADSTDAAQGIADLTLPATDGPPTDLATRADLAPGARCGGFAGTTCPTDQFCDIPYECGFADGSGTCELKPSGCPKNLDPVCGCDGKQYDNECFCHAAGVGVKNHGVCGCPGCGQGKYCTSCFGQLACLPQGAVC